MRKREAIKWLKVMLDDYSAFVNIIEHSNRYSNSPTGAKWQDGIKWHMTKNEIDAIDYAYRRIK